MAEFKGQYLQFAEVQAEIATGGRSPSLVEKLQQRAGICLYDFRFRPCTTACALPWPRFGKLLAKRMSWPTFRIFSSYGSRASFRRISNFIILATPFYALKNICSAHPMFSRLISPGKPSSFQTRISAVCTKRVTHPAWLFTMRPVTESNHPLVFHV